jgi:hypothetical protein
MDFDGTNDKIEFGDVNNFERTNSFSGSCWVFYEGVTGASQYIISKHNSSNNKGYQFYLNSVGSLNFIIGPGPGGAVMQVAAGIQQANTWNHFVFTYDGSSLRTGINIYVNGVIQTPFYAGASSITGTIKDASIPFQISGRSGTSANGVNGKIDQVSIFDYELSSSQVSTLYGGGTAVTNPMTLSPKPIAYYQLGDQSVDNGANYLVPNNSLSGSEGFSPYALSLDGVNDYLDANRTVASNLGFSVSAWINPTSYATVMLGTRNLSSASTSNGFTMNINSSGNLFGRIFTETSNIIQVQTGSTISLNNWSHVAMTYDSSTKTLKLYLNGAQAGSIVGTDPSVASIADLDIGRASVGTFYDYFVGKLSNVALWDTDLSSTEVTEIYNQGVPSNLNNFSGTAPVSWWQLGSNSSFNTNWTCLDEIGTNNAVSVNMTNDDIVDGVGYSASGLGTSSIDIKGDAPYSTANGLSKNMDVLDRTTDTPS